MFTRVVLPILRSKVTAVYNINVRYGLTVQVLCAQKVTLRTYLLKLHVFICVQALFMVIMTLFFAEIKFNERKSIGRGVQLVFLARV